MKYITSIRSNSESGDRVHVNNVTKYLKLNHKSARFLKLYFYLIIYRKGGVVRESIDLILLGVFLPNFILSWLLSPWIVEVNGSILDEKGLIKFLIKGQKKNFKVVKKIVVVSEGLKARFLNLYSLNNDRIVVVRNGGPFVNHPVNIFDGVLRMAFVGANASWQEVKKNIQKIVENIDISFIQIEVIVAGSGFENEIDTLLNNRVKIKYRGLVSFNEARSIYRNCNIVLCTDTRVYDKMLLSSPIKAYEGLLLGKLVLFTNDWNYKVDFSELESKKILLMNDMKDSSRVIKLINSGGNTSNFRKWTDVAADIDKIATL
jgi:glycosyltransferase involved in cell wall biosynthesis